MVTENRLIEIPADGIIRVPIMQGDSTVGERRIDLSDIPVVDAVEVVHGRWIESTNTVYMMSQYTCSECGGKHIAKTWNYCPNCKYTVTSCRLYW